MKISIASSADEKSSLILFLMQRAVEPLKKAYRDHWLTKLPFIVWFRTSLMKQESGKVSNNRHERRRVKFVVRIFQTCKKYLELILASTACYRSATRHIIVFDWIKMLFKNDAFWALIFSNSPSNYPRVARMRLTRLVRSITKSSSLPWLSHFWRTSLL